MTEEIESFQPPKAFAETGNMLETIAKWIEIFGTKTPCNHGVCTRDGKDMTVDELWNSLTDEQKDTRINEAQGAWVSIQDIGVEKVMAQAFADYLWEK